MRLKKLVLSISLLFLIPLLTVAKANEIGTVISAQEVFSGILKDHWSAANEEQIFFRKDPDTFRMNGKLPDISAQGRQRRALFNEQLLVRLQGVDAQNLSPEQLVSYRLFKFERQAEAKSHQQIDHFYPLNFYSSFWSYFAGAPGNMSFLALADYENYLVSLADYPRYSKQYVTNLSEAIEQGHVHYCQSIDGFDKTISKHLVSKVEDSVFYAPFANMPSSIKGAEQARLTRKGKALIQSKVLPEYQSLLKFFQSQYMPNCRKEVGITALNSGEEYYQYLIEFYTTTDYTAEEIHQLGLSEVARIKAEMLALIKEIGFKGSFKEFFAHLREEPSFYAESPLQLIEKASYITRKMAAQLPKWFTQLPRSTFDIKASPGGGAYYVASDGSGATSGTYFLDATNFKSQPLYNLEALTFHEAEPGHHFQGSIAMELEVPEFRKTLYHSAYGEGWGLYSESLGKEMGFYEDPYSDFGRLTYEMWRACRLVVDTGMHAKGWSRQQAVDYLAANSALTIGSVEGQIDRYITWPAQALSYKIGELKIRELRKYAEQELGENFDIRLFHDQLLTNGSLPLALLEELLIEWVAQQKLN
jgi:uncharacterized protein (DUF885 family)